MKIISSAPGKLILFGEHASSRGKPAIIFAVNSRLTATLQANKKSDEILLTSRELNVYREPYPTSALDLVSEAISFFYELTGCSKEPLELIIHSDILPGFGSSAAAIIATLGALNAYYGTDLSPFQLFELGFKTNFSIKGYGSGLDIATALYGGLILYQKGTKSQKLPFEQLDFIVGNTGVKAPSAPIVRSVRKFEQKEPATSKAIFNEMERIVLAAEQAILANDKPLLGQLMNKNQQLLRELKVSSPILEKLISASLKAGALGAKLSGAGVGDNMIALVKKEQKEKVIRAINSVQGNALASIMIDPQGLVVYQR
ncbi:MAG: mevalonate kinase [Candidatus Heimdallarchaeota archaeon]|nr:mevalonate kinase [Candidatus Heimdallarchaeota archaeon]